MLVPSEKILILNHKHTYMCVRTHVHVCVCKCIYTYMYCLLTYHAFKLSTAT